MSNHITAKFATLASGVFSYESKDEQQEVFEELYKEEIKERLPIAKKNFYNCMRSACIRKQYSMSFKLDRLCTPSEKIMNMWEAYLGRDTETTDPAYLDWLHSNEIERLWADFFSGYLKQVEFDCNVTGFLMKPDGPYHSSLSSYGCEKYEIIVKWRNPNKPEEIGKK